MSVKTATCGVVIGLGITLGGMSARGKDGEMRLLRCLLWSALIALGCLVAGRPAQTDVLVLETGGPGASAVAFSPDGGILATESRRLEGESIIGKVILRDGRTGEVQRAWDAHESAVTCLAFSPDGQTFATGSRDGSAKLWHTKSGRSVCSLLGHSISVDALCFSPDGKTVATGDYGNTVRLWDARTGELRQTLAGHSSRQVYSIIFSTTGDTVTSTSGACQGSSTGDLKVWNSRTGDLKRTLTWKPEPYFEFPCLSPDAQTVASAGIDGKVRMWDARTGALRRALSGHGRGVYALAFSPDGKTLASGGRDRTVRLWDVRTGKSIRALTGHSATIWHLAFSPNGRTLASGSEDGTVRLWPVR